MQFARLPWTRGRQGGDAVPEKRQIVRNTLAVSSLQILQMVSAFIFLPFLLRSFGLNDYGLYMLVTSVAGYLVLLDLGFGNTIIKFTAEYLARDEKQRVGRLVTTGYLFYGLVGVASAIVLVLLGLAGQAVFKVEPGTEYLVRNLFLVAAGVSLLVWPLSVGGYLLGGMQRYNLSARVGSVAILGNVAATALVIWTGEGPVALYAATGSVSVLAAVSYSLMALRTLRGFDVHLLPPDRETFKQVASFSASVFVMQAASIAMYQQTDRLVLGTFASSSSIARYEPGAKLYGLFTQISNMLATAVLPAASQLSAQERSDTLRQLLLRGNRYLVVVIVPAAAALLVLAGDFLRAWLRIPLTPAQTIPAMLFVGVWLVTANIPVPSALLLGSGKTRFLAWWQTLQALVNVGLSVMLVAVFKFDVLGVVLGTTTTAIIAAPFLLLYAFKTCRIAWLEWLKQVGWAYGLLPLTFGIAFAGRAFGMTSSLIGVILVLGAAVLAHWGAMYAFGLRPEEREDVKQLLRIGLARLGVVR